MAVWYRATDFFLSRLDAETAHNLAIRALKSGLKPRDREPDPPSLAVTVWGRTLPNPIGLAAGFDKNAEVPDAMLGMGFGLVEIGSVTPKPQEGNARPRLFRLGEDSGVINRMGFNGAGLNAALARLSARPRQGFVGVNVGANKDSTNRKADYVTCAAALAPHADYLVCNVSSPNTPGLRQLQEPEALERLLRAVRGRLDQVAPNTPLFLKIAPDLAPEAVDAITDVAIACGIQGLIATNTTLTRPFEHALAKESGGLSGRPLRDMSTQVLRRAYARGKGKLAFIGVGGVLDAEDVYAKLRAGASLVQLYTGFIYGGPSTVRTLLRGLAERLERDGFTSVEEAIGADLR
jgi:dihydroorotate dehydrogenase